jgi:hypothetical protein
LGEAEALARQRDGTVMMMPENLIVFDGVRKLVGV